MALEEISFNTITGEEINITNLVNQMIDYYQQKLEVGETKVTDFNQGSEIRNLLEAFAVGIYAVIEEANEFAKKPFISLSSDGWLDRIGENPFINLPRIEGSYADGYVTFTLKEVQTEDFIIPAETVVVDSVTGLDFSTTMDCIINVGETSGEASVECLTMGADGNSNSGDVNIISDVNTELNIDLLTVTNPEAFENGADYEDDEDYRLRLLENVRSDGFGTMGYYKALGESVDGVHDVLLVDTMANYTKLVLVNGDNKPVEDEVLLNVLAEYTDADKHILNHSFTVSNVNYTDVDIDVVLSVSAEIPLSELNEHIKCLFDGGYSPAIIEYKGLNINEVLTKDIVVGAFDVFEFVLNVDSIIFNSDADLTEVAPDFNRVLKLNHLNITQNIV